MISIMLKMYSTSFSGILEDAEIFVGSVHAFADTYFFTVIDVLFEIAGDTLINTDG